MHADAELYLDRQAVGTQTGLAKMPYLRDTRRSVGIGGFRLAYTDIYNPGQSESPQRKRKRLKDLFL